MAQTDSGADAYIKGFPGTTQTILHQIRQTIRSTAPEATEKMAYGIPTYWQKRNLIHFGGFPHHIGIYPGPAAIEAFAKDIRTYETAKGTLKLPLDRPIPYDLIMQLTKYNLARLK